jgi:hypothetical protein
VPYQLELRAVEQARNVVPGAGEKVVETDDVFTRIDQSRTEMRTDEARAPAYQYLHDYHLSIRALRGEP